MRATYVCSLLYSCPYIVPNIIVYAQQILFEWMHKLMTSKSDKRASNWFNLTTILLKVEVTCTNYRVNFYIYDMVLFIILIKIL